MCNIPLFNYTHFHSFWQEQISPLPLITIIAFPIVLFYFITFVNSYFGFFPFLPRCICFAPRHIFGSDYIITFMIFASRADAYYVFFQYAEVAALFCKCFNKVVDFYVVTPSFMLTGLSAQHSCFFVFRSIPRLPRGRSCIFPNSRNSA